MSAIELSTRIARFALLSSVQQVGSRRDAAERAIVEINRLPDVRLKRPVSRTYLSPANYLSPALSRAKTAPGMIVAVRDLFP
jgi:hypothetical protein